MAGVKAQRRDIPAMLGLKTNVRFSFTTVPNDGGILCALGNGNTIYGAYYYVPNKGFFYATGARRNARGRRGAERQW